MCCLYFKGLKWLKTDIFMFFKQYILLKYLNCHMIDYNIFYKDFIYCKAILVIVVLLKYMLSHYILLNKIFSYTLYLILFFDRNKH